VASVIGVRPTQRSALRTVIPRKNWVSHVISLSWSKTAFMAICSLERARARLSRGMSINPRYQVCAKLSLRG